MRFRSHILRFALAAVFAGPTAAFAADIKDLILSDCPAATKALAAQSPSERAQLAPFFREVLKLSIQAAPDLPQLPLPRTATGIPLPESALDSIWKGFSAGREETAKLCALRLLPQLKEAALVAVPEMLELATEPTLSDELVLLLDTTLFTLLNENVESAAVSDVQRIASAGATHLEPLGWNVLALLPSSISVQALIAAAQTAGTEKHPLIREALHWIDPFGEHTQAAVLSELKNSPSLEHTRSYIGMLGDVRCPSEAAARELVRLSTDSPAADAALDALRALAITISTPQRCPTPRHAVLGAELLEMLFAELSPNSKGEETAEQLRLRATRLSFAAPLLSGRALPRVLPYLQPILETSLPDPLFTESAVAAIRAIGPQSLGLIDDALGSEHESVRRRAAAALESLSELDARKLRPLVARILDSDAVVREKVYRTLLPFATELRPELRALGAAPSADYGLERLLLRIAAGIEFSESDLPALETLSRRACAEPPTGISGAASVPGPVREEVLKKISACLAEELAPRCEYLGWVEGLQNLPVELRSAFIDRFSRDALTCSTRKIVDPDLKTGLRPSSDRLIEELNSEDEASLVRAARLLQEFEQLPEEAVDPLRRIATSESSSARSRCIAVQTLRRAKNSAEILPDVLEAFEKEDAPLDCVSCIDSARAVPLLLAKLQNAPPRKRSCIAQMLAAYHGEARMAVPQLKELVISSELDPRFNAITALLEIDAQPAEIALELRDNFKTRYAYILSRKRLPQATLESLRAVTVMDNPLVKLLFYALEERSLTDVPERCAPLQR